MNKILIVVHVPLLENNYDVFVPVSKTVADTTQLLSKMIHDLTDGAFPIKMNTLLYDRQTGGIYDGNLTLKDAGISNGMHLILI